MQHSQDYLFFVRLFFILNFNYFFLFKQVWTQKCAVQKSSVNVNISYYLLKKKKKKNHGHKVPGFF